MNALGLENCPFCNSDNVDLNGDEDGIYASCASCAASGPEAVVDSARHVGFAAAGALAVQAWNKRTIIVMDHFGEIK